MTAPTATPVARLPHIMMAARPLSPDERALLTHVSRWGSDGYPVTHLRRAWTWEYGTVRAPRAWRTRRETVANLEAFLGTLRDLRAAESYRRAHEQEPQP